MHASDEEFIPEDEAEEGPGLVKKLREKLKKAVEEKQEYLEGWQRARADFANYKKEEASMHADREDRTKTQLIEELLPALDTFELALKHGNKELEMVERQLIDGLKRLGVERFGAPGETFDPYKFEALMEVPTDEEERDHTVESVHRAGYSAGSRIIRPAQVAVYIKK
jgi:molecular chaperone GrpE